MKRNGAKEALKCSEDASKLGTTGSSDTDREGQV